MARFSRVMTRLVPLFPPAAGRLIAPLLTGDEAYDCAVAERLIDGVEPAERMLSDNA
jgi:hypothetical protein